jgi:porphobilinogen deaminase
VPGAYLPALIEARGDRIAVEAELARMPEADGPCRTALAVLLLRVNGAFRLVRAVLAPDSRALLEVSLSRPAGAAELGEALAALAVAARHVALEARLVASDAGIARAFLDLGGMLPPL